MEEKRPLSRKYIDEMISKLEKELGEAVTKKEYEKCPPLQKKLDELLIKRAESSSFTPRNRRNTFFPCYCSRATI